jgi:hypothetical protein
MKSQTEQESVSWGIVSISHHVEVIAICNRRLAIANKVAHYCRLGSLGHILVLWTLLNRFLGCAPVDVDDP